MRIAHLFRILVALLHLFLYVIPASCRLTQNSTVVNQHHHRHHQRTSPRYNHNSTWSEFGRWLSPPEAQLLLRQEAGSVEGRVQDNRSRGATGAAVDCCPSIVEMVEPEGGKNMDGMFVELYRDGSNRQRFYEVSCRQEVEGKPCRFMDKKLHNQSRCIQKFSYTYALVKETPELRHNHHHMHHTSGVGYFPTIPGSGPGGSSWMMDYIEVRSGCSCVVYPKPRPAKKTSRVKPTKRPQQHTTITENSEVFLQT